MPSGALATIEVIGGRDLEGRFARMIDTLKREQRLRLMESTQVYQAAVKQEAPRSQPNPFKANGPHIADNILTRTLVNGDDRITMEVYVPPVFAQRLLWITKGTRPHRIDGNPLLRFYWPKGPNGAGVYFFRHVNHPGTQPNDFPARAMSIVRAEILRNLNQVAARTVAEAR